MRGHVAGWHLWASALWGSDSWWQELQFRFERRRHPKSEDVRRRKVGTNQAEIQAGSRPQRRQKREQEWEEEKGTAGELGEKHGLHCGLPFTMHKRDDPRHPSNAVGAHDAQARTSRPTSS